MCSLFTHKIRDNIREEKFIKKKLVKGQTSANRNSLQIYKPIHSLSLSEINNFIKWIFS